MTLGGFCLGVLAESESSLVLERAWVAGLIFLPLLATGLVVDVALLMRWRAKPVGWARRVRRLFRRPWTALDALALAVGLPGALLFLGPLLGRLPRMPALLAQTLLLHGLVLGYVGAVMWRRGMSVRQAFGIRWTRLGRDIGAGLVTYLAALPLVATYSAVGRFLLRRAGYPLDTQPVLELFTADHSLAVRLLLLGFAVLMAPLTEELLFRGIGQVAASRHWGMPLAVLVGSVVFAAVHGHAPTFAPLFVAAAAFSLGYVYTGSLTTAITAHMVFNGVTLGVLYLAA